MLISDGARRLYRVIDGITENLVAVMLAVMVINVSINVLTRYVFFYPVIWAEEFARYIMIWFAFFGMSLALRDHDHVAITIVKDLFPPPVRRVIHIVLDLLILGFLVLLLYQSLRYMGRLRSQTSPAMGISMQIPYFSVTLGAFLMVLQQIKRIVLTVVGGAI
jgi:TRAP-type transport system small permease protein